MKNISHYKTTKRISCSLIVTLLTFGCAVSPYSKTTMVQIKDKRNFAPVDAKDFLLEDKNIILKYVPDIVEAGIDLQFTNKSSKPVKIIWDESAFISPENKSQKIFHSGVKIIDRTQAQTPTVIPQLGALDDMMIPVDNVNWEYDTWSYKPLCGVRSIYTHELDDSGCINQTFGFYLTYELEGKKNSLTLKYKYLSKEALPKK